MIVISFYSIPTVYTKFNNLFLKGQDRKVKGCVFQSQSWKTESDKTDLSTEYNSAPITLADFAFERVEY